jgi:spermidine/putrescine transport system permease protein
VLRIVLPLSATGLLVGALLSFVPAAGASIEPELLGGPSGQFITNDITAQFLTANDWPTAAALSVTFFVTVALVCCGIAVAIAALRWGRLMLRDSSYVGNTP